MSSPLPGPVRLPRGLSVDAGGDSGVAVLRVVYLPNVYGIEGGGDNDCGRPRASLAAAAATRLGRVWSCVRLPATTFPVYVGMQGCATTQVPARRRSVLLASLYVVLSSRQRRRCRRRLLSHGFGFSGGAAPRLRR